jgi:uncharacterized membrane protein YdbT with pleckstrin-like domain
MTQDLRDAPEPTEARSLDDEKLSPVDYLILGLCVVGVFGMLYLVLDYSGIALFNGHAAEVVAEFWDRYANIGMVIVIVVMVIVSIFVWILAKSTLGSDEDEYRLDIDADA